MIVIINTSEVMIHTTTFGLYTSKSLETHEYGWINLLFKIVIHVHRPFVQLRLQLGFWRSREFLTRLL